MEEINNSNHIPYHLILEELEGNISAAQLQELENWKAASPDHLHLYLETIEVADHTELLKEYQKVDVQKAWQKFNPSIPVGGKVMALHSEKKTGLHFLKWAVAVVVVASGALLLVNEVGWMGNQTVHTAIDERKNLVLPDGTAVFMNGNTTITYNNRKFLTSRKLQLLSGQAYFEVVHDDKKPFSIQVDDLNVKDIGTSFDLKVNPEHIEVVVSSGQVVLEHPDQKTSVLLSAQEKGTFNRSTKKINYGKNNNQNYRSWQNKVLKYQQTPLSEVSRDLLEVYGTTLVFQDSTLKSRKLSAYFKDKSVDEIMKIIGVSLQLKVTKSARTFVLSN